MLHVDGWFYWYGENKERTNGQTEVWHWGIRFYRSRDLYNWEDLGVVIPPNLDDRSSPLHPAQLLDRPHIIHNARTGQYVCWIKIMADPLQTRAVLVADTLLGPYRLVGSNIQPLGMNAGDFDLAVSEEDGKAYMYFERVHSELICADLDADYTGFSGYYSTHMHRHGPPEVRESPAYFYRQGVHYLATSGTTGYFPNPSEIASAPGFHGPWTTLGDLHPDDRSRTSFNTQVCCIFKHPHKRDLYISIGDRWMGDQSGDDFETGRLSGLVGSAFHKRFGRPKQEFDADEAAAFKIAGTLAVDTSRAGQVWLPVDFSGDRPVIRWRDEWSLDEFE